ncbi:Hypothetical predicted protein [Pelobates cultripes]|uniref:Uncharacterized protein n=1 Tax=Pelobates cultripes TaxID=61616 RepID=A0AAD1THJ6_PELCU|nr:Hypothetical predicted protein [Pelobates cultripes]
MATPIQSLHIANPTLDHRPWTQRGCTRIEHLYKEGKLEPYPILKHKYQLPNATLFTYLQIKALLENETTTTPTPLKHVYHICTTGNIPKKTLSLLYATLNDNPKTPPKDKFKEH